MIPVRNIYHMLAYAFRAFDKAGFQSLGEEEFEGACDLCAAVLARGVEHQVKRGLGRTYSERTESLSTLRGRIEVSESMKSGSIMRRQLVCSYDEFVTDTMPNRIVKATMTFLVACPEVGSARKYSLRRLLPYLAAVADIDLRHVDWKIRLGRNDQTYKLLLFICHLVCDGLLMTENGQKSIPGYFDDQMACKLYERFILEYYRKEHPEISANAEQVPWAGTDADTGLLPIMQTDITLRKGEQVLIIDAKYYTSMTQESYGAHTLHSGNLYQIFTYVKNMQATLGEGSPRVKGMLMYARTDERLLPDGDYHMSGNEISIRSLDLSCEFEVIRAQLDEVIGNLEPRNSEHTLFDGANCSSGRALPAFSNRSNR